MTGDAVHVMGKSVIQHGHHNQRIYVMKISPGDIPAIIRPLDALAEQERYSKIFVKVPQSSVPVFSAAGYVVEATVPYFFNGEEAAAFMAKYFDPKRREVASPAIIGDVLSVAFTYAQKEFFPELPAGFSLVAAHYGDAEPVAALYRSVFESYPFPITDPEYVARSMKDGIRYFTIRQSKRIVAAASFEINTEAQNAEVSDFATDPLFRGKGLAGILLHAMEDVLQKEGIRLAYTIARAGSEPVNILFARAGYEYAGLLPNNTNICGKFESMNVWYKALLAGSHHV